MTVVLVLFFNKKSAIKKIETCKLNKIAVTSVAAGAVVTNIAVKIGVLGLSRGSRYSKFLLIIP